MRNLQITRYEEDLVEENLPLTATAWNLNDDSVLCAFGPSPDNPVIHLKRRQRRSGTDTQLDGSVFVPITSWDAPCPIPELEYDEILLMHHFPETATTCIVLAGGDLILIREDPAPGQEAIEIIGSIDDGISAAAWAPDEEVLAVVTRTDNLVLMSRSLEPLNEVSMTTDDLRASKHVSVGWGKKETQFQGKRAKAMRDPTMPEYVDEGKLSPLEDGSVSISWRGDGAYLAVNSLVPNSRRVIRIFTREGGLDGVSEPIDGLESALSWRPAGNLIASIKRSMTSTDEERLEVVFLERNGLRHGEFDLRIRRPHTTLQASKVRLDWNSSSSVLAVCFMDSIQFWTMGNYHYYLKQDINVASTPGRKPVLSKWHPEKPLDCSIWNEKKLVLLSSELQVCRGSTIAPNDFGSTAVIDGKILKITPLRQAGIPPPMAFCELQAESNISDCAFSKSGLLIATVDQDHVRLHRWRTSSTTTRNQDEGLRLTTELDQIFVKEVSNVFGGQRQSLKICFETDDHLYILSPAQQNQPAQCCVLDLRSESTIHTSLPVPQSAQILQADSRQETTWISDDRDVTMINREGSDQAVRPKSFDKPFPKSAIFRLPAPSPISNGTVYAEAFHQVSLKSNGSLLVDDTLIARDCTSFVVTDMHLVFTTAQHYLKFAHLSSPETMEVPEDIPEADERCRAVERGATVVTVMPSVYAVVLQMPRGNLETIYPRVLVVAGIRKSLECLDYRTAFLACQVHQVDMNILYDHLPETLLQNVPKFIDDLKKPGRIDEFLSKLRDEDVTQKLYKDTLKASDPDTILDASAKQSERPTTSTIQASGGKVNLICDTFITVLNKQGPKYMTNVITAHVCKRPPDLSAALMLISSLRRNSPDEADTAVSHLCFLTDTNRLYDAALGLYDLDLTLLVAQNAQRDPREYMPFLQSLQALPTLRRQYQIDNHLKQYRKALVSLHSLKAHEEVEAYTIRHVLYTTAMDLYKYDQENLSRVTALYAEYLESQSSYASAATLRESLKQYDLAYPLYALAHLWRECLTCATLASLEDSKLASLASSLATTCAEESRDYRSAAAIQVDYLRDIPSAARLLCKGSYFAEAARLLALNNLSSEISTIIDPGLTEKFGEIVELVADCKTQLAAQVPRIIELRQKKLEDPLAFYGGDAAAMAADGINIDIPDNISLAPTDATTAGGQSLFTRYGSNASKFGGTVASNISRKTSKTKRREERKRARGKKGSVYEEEYLIGSVGRLIERINGVQDEVQRLTSGMLRRGLREQSAKVDEIMKEICLLCERARVQVWQIQENENQVDENVTGDAVDNQTQFQPTGADGVFWDSQVQVNMPDKKQAPIVKKWTENLLVIR